MSGLIDALLRVIPYSNAGLELITRGKWQAGTGIELQDDPTTGRTKIVATGSVAAISPLTTKGDVYTHDASADARLAVGPNGYMLTADSTQATGLKWAPVTITSPATTKGDVLAFGTALDRLPVGANDQVLTADSTQPLGVKWADAGTASPLTTKGDLYTWDTDNQRLAVGTDGQALIAASGQATGLAWVDGGSIALAASGTSYTPSSSTIGGHRSGIDTALGLRLTGGTWAADNRLLRADGTGRAVQVGVATEDDSGNVSGWASVAVSASGSVVPTFSLSNGDATSGERRWLLRVNDDGSVELGTASDAGTFTSSGIKTRRDGTDITHQEISSRYGVGEAAPSVFASSTATSGGGNLLNIGPFPLLIDEDDVGVAVAEGRLYIFSIHLDITVTGGNKGLAVGTITAWRPTGGSIAYDADLVIQTLKGAGTQIDWQLATFAFTDAANVLSLEIDWDLSSPTAYEATANVTVSHVHIAHAPEI